MERQINQKKNLKYLESSLDDDDEDDFITCY